MYVSILHKVKACDIISLIHAAERSAGTPGVQ